jgi:hypothetical protein
MEGCEAMTTGLYVTCHKCGNSGPVWSTAPDVQHHAAIVVVDDTTAGEFHVVCENDGELRLTDEFLQSLADVEANPDKYIEIHLYPLSEAGEELTP